MTAGPPLKRFCLCCEIWARMPIRTSCGFVDLTVPAAALDDSVTADDLDLDEDYLLKVAKSWNTHGMPMTWTSYRASRLYIVNGQLRYKDFGRDTRIGIWAL